MFKRHFSNFFERVEHAGCPASPTLSTKSALEPEQAISRPLADAIELATKLMREHGLTGWRVKLDHARRRAGQCDYNTKVISLSRLYVRIFAIRFFMKLRMRLLGHITAMMRCGAKKRAK